jgi:hypothetical protein
VIRAYCATEDLPEAAYVLQVHGRGIRVEDGRGAAPSPDDVAVCWGVEPPPGIRASIVIPRTKPGSFQRSAFTLSPAPSPRLDGRSIPILSSTAVADVPEGEPFLRDSAGRVWARRRGGSLRLSFDLLFNAFARLSSLEEWLLEEKEPPVHGDGSRPAGLPSTPDVDFLFAVLDACLASSGVPPFPARRWGVMPSHDIDFVRKTGRLRVRQGIFHAYNSLRSLGRGNIGHACSLALKSMLFPLSSGDYWQFPKILQLEKELQARSSFFVYSRATGFPQSAEQKRIDPAYVLSEHSALQEQLRDVAAQGWEVGLHGSIQAFDEEPLLKAEVEALANAVGRPPRSGRQHWLRFSHRRSWDLFEQVGFKADLTMGWNDRLGFRTGLTRPHPAWDHAKRKPRPILIVPVPVMDGTLFQHQYLPYDEAWERSLALLKDIRDFEGFASINWHQRTLSPDYGWYDTFRRSLEWVRSNGGAAISVSDYLDHEHAAPS